MNLKGLVGTPTFPHPHELVEEKARGMLDKAKAATVCDTPLIALNELWRPARDTPWPESVLRYRNNILVLLRNFDSADVVPFLVLPEPSVSIDDDARVVKRGKKGTLSGTVESVRPNELITVYARGPGSGEYVLVDDAMVGPDGSWSLTVKPKDPGVTTYRALSKSAASAELAVRVEAGKKKR
jgi:hypothetical protein